MLYRPRARNYRMKVSLLQRSNFYREDFPPERPSQSFKEPQRVTPVALSASRTLPIRNALIVQGFVAKVKSMPQSLRESFGIAKFIPRLKAGDFFRGTVKFVNERTSQAVEYLIP